MVEVETPFAVTEEGEALTEDWAALVMPAV
jgi:hypothetical protein